MATKPVSTSNGLPLALTMGEPAGIGPDIILSAWMQRRRLKLPPFVVIGDASVLTRRAAMLGLAVTTAAYLPGDTPSPLAGGLPVISLPEPMRGIAGKPDVADAGQVVAAIDLAVAMVVEGKAGGIVTAPIAKEILYKAGFKHPGHTEYLAALAERHGFAPARPVMMIASDLLRTIPVTIHIPLARVAERLTTTAIIETCEIAARDLQLRFGISEPRIAVAGLNPHAGEGGALGEEDEAIVAPAVARLRAMGLEVTGPLPADTMFHERARKRYDVAVCMYHDQALIPAKTLAFDDGVNVTLGLPFIRTSPDHGTAFDIAGSGKANASSLVAALRMAAFMARHEKVAARP